MNSFSRAPAPWAGVCYGVDDTPERAICVKAERRRGGVTFSRVQVGEIPPAGSLPRGAVIAACLQQQRSFARWLTAPLESPRKARRVFPSILDVQLPFPIEDCEHDLLEVRAVAGRGCTRGLMAGARGVEIERRLEELRSAGIAPHVLDQEGLALWTQSLDELPPGGIAAGERIRVVIYAADSRVTLAVGRRREFLGAHALRKIEPDAVHRLIAPYAKETAPEVEWVWTGPLAVDGEAVRTLQSPLSQRWPGPSQTVAEPEAFLARAVAARAISGGPLRWNFRRNRFAHPAQQAREDRAPYVLASSLLAAGLFLCAVNIAWQTVSARRLAAVQRENAALAARVVGAPVPFQQEVRSARRALDERMRLMEPFAAAGGPGLQAPLGRLLAIAREEGLAFESMTMGLPSATVRGTAAKWRQCDNAIKRFEQSGWTVKMERKGDAGDTQARFVMTIGWKR